MRCTWGQRPRGSSGRGPQNCLQEQPVFTLGLRGSKSRDTVVPSSFVEPKACFFPLLVMGYVYHLPSKVSHQSIGHRVGLGLQDPPHQILPEFDTWEDLQSFLRHSRPYVERRFFQV